jgi:divalent metal cation (Fe/Co/Zn/Cd) transporter
MKSSEEIISKNLSNLLDFLFDNQDVADILTGVRQRSSNRRKKDVTTRSKR